MSRSSGYDPLGPQPVLRTLGSDQYHTQYRGNYEDEEDDQHYEIMNMRTEGFTELKKANRVYNECFTKTFMPRWFAGENVQVAEVCASQWEDMREKTLAVYGDDDKGVPFNTWKMPTAPMQ